MYNTNICFEGVREIMTILTLDNRLEIQTRETPEYKAVQLTITRQRSTTITRK